MPSGHAGFRPPTYLEGATTKILDILSGGGKVLDYLGGPCTFGGDPSLRAIIWGLTLTVLDISIILSCKGRNLRLRWAFSK